MKGKLLILLIVLFFTTGTIVVHGQSAYVNTQEGIFRLTGIPGSSERIMISNGCGTDNNILSTAIYKDTVYYNTWAGELKRFKAGVPEAARH
ncbi:MAG: hypothetical protein WDO16_13840 [Bacteroidota bacterium]